MPEDFSQRLPYMARMVGNALSHRLEQTLRRFGLTHAQLATLAQLGLEHPRALSGARMGHRAGVTAQAMSNAVTSLEGRGLVTRQPNPSHGRILDVRITDAGMQLLDRAQAATRQVEEEAMSGLTPTQRRQLKDLLGRLMVALDLPRPGTGGR